MNSINQPVLMEHMVFIVSFFLETYKVFFTKLQILLLKSFLIKKS